MKGFIKCKAKVFEAFFGLDLWAIVLEVEEQEEEEEVEVLTMKVEMVEAKGTKEIETTKDTGELESSVTESAKEIVIITIEHTRAREATKKDSHVMDTGVTKNSKGAKITIRAEGDSVRENVAMVMAKIDVVVKAITVDPTSVTYRGK